MAENIELHSFPNNRTEALAYLYVQSQDLKGKAPSEIQTMYYEAYYALKKDYNAKYASGWFMDKERNG